MTISSDALAALEDQRDHLLTSLEDLEREHAAGDVDDHDYLALKDDYTARAAAVLRAIEAGRAPVGPPSPRRSITRPALIVLGVVAFAVLAGVLLAQAAGRRDPGEFVTGDIRQSVTERLNEAGRRSAEGGFTRAIEIYDDVLVDQPANAEAMTYRGWLLTLDGQQEEGLTVLLEAATIHPDYPDVHAFLAVVFFRNGLIEEADRELDRLDALDPPAALRDQVAGLRAQVDAALEGQDPSG
ncbi:MAG: tetratricopeptide repeat protein [Acidimicrobiales bacterium]